MYLYKIINFGIIVLMIVEILQKLQQFTNKEKNFLFNKKLKFIYKKAYINWKII
jgi:hypothetical protein